MTPVLLDTSAYSAAKKNRTEVQQAMAEADGIFFSPITVGELLAGFHKGNQFERNAEQLQRFLKEEVKEVLPLELATAERYAIIHEYLRKAGTPVAPNDLWIAATAMQHGLKVLTTDRDFQKIPQILIQLF